MITSEYINLLNHNYIMIMAVIIYFNDMVSTLSPYIHALIHYVMDYNNYDIKNKDNKMKILKNIKNYYRFNYDENSNPYGYIIDCSSIIPKYYINVDKEEYTFHIFCKKETLNTLLRDNYVKKEIKLDEDYVPTEETSDREKRTNELLNHHDGIYYISTCGFRGDLHISIRNINLNLLYKDLEFNDKQSTLFKSIMNHYKIHNYCTVFINGPPGVGKTFFSYIMAQKLNCYLTDNYIPTEPGSSINSFYNKTKKISATKPLIVILDEIDVMISNIHHHRIQQHKKLKTEVYDKVSWNMLFDKINYGLYPYVIFVMTSNKDKKYIDEMDPCYLRDGRVTVFDTW